MSRGVQLELFPPGTGFDVSMQKDPNWGFNGWRWFCSRCNRGGSHYSGQRPDLLKWARKNHKCREFYTDSLKMVH